MGFNRLTAIILILLLLAAISTGCQGVRADVPQPNPIAGTVAPEPQEDNRDPDSSGKTVQEPTQEPVETDTSSEPGEEKPAPAPASVTEISLVRTSLDLALGQDHNITYSIKPADAANKAVTWTSSAPGVASVDKAGQVKALANGTAVITAKTQDGGKTATLTVTVFTPVTSVKVSPSSLTLPLGGTSQLRGEVLPGGASNKAVTWSTSDGAVASVSSTGLVTARGVGRAVITLRSADGGHTARMTVVVCSVEELQMFQQVNIERAKVGLPALKWNGELARIARIKSQDIIDNDYWSHTSPVYGNVDQMLNHFGVRWVNCGENLAKFSCCLKAQEALMDSETHRKNILNPKFTEIGIGIVQNANGHFFITQLFIRPTP